MEKMTDKLKGGESKEGENKGSGEAKKEHEGLGERVKEDMHKMHEYDLKEEQKEASDDIWGGGGLK
jgi:hypothetical protein